jgi:tetratricopeptide (TPR) repeat protein
MAVVVLVLGGGFFAMPRRSARRAPSPPPRFAAELPTPPHPVVEEMRGAGEPEQEAPPPARSRVVELRPDPVENDPGQQDRAKATAPAPAPATAAVPRRRKPSAAAAAPISAAYEAIEGLAIGQQALEAGELRLAEQELKRALFFAPSNVEVVAALAEVRFEMARYKEALLLAQKATRLAPDNAKYQVLLGDVSFKLGLASDAAAAYARARFMKPDDAGIKARFELMTRSATSGGD